MRVFVGVFSDDADISALSALDIAVKCRPDFSKNARYLDRLGSQEVGQRRRRGGFDLLAEN